MMNWIKLFAAVIIGYLIGSFSFSITISEIFFGGDVRQKGSGNAGATNMARTYGILPGLLTLAGDFMKAAVTMTVGSLLGGETGLAAAGIACMTGHSWPVYYNFKGGKGVSVGLAIAFAADWRAGVTALAAFAAVVLISKKVSLSSISAAAAVILVSVFLPGSVPGRIMTGYAAAVILYRHKENIHRLLRHEEPNFKVGKSTKDKTK